MLAPCALGGTLDDDTIGALTASVVCGAANNQLAHPGIEKMLADRGIVYAPDYLVNSGGLIQVADELEGFSFGRAKSRAETDFRHRRARFSRSRTKEGVPPGGRGGHGSPSGGWPRWARLRGIWLPG